MAASCAAVKVGRMREAAALTSTPLTYWVPAAAVPTDSVSEVAEFQAVSGVDQDVDQHRMLRKVGGDADGGGAVLCTSVTCCIRIAEPLVGADAC
jgi:hypothetical protein